jgi:hypothetical protein
MTKKKK